MVLKKIMYHVSYGICAATVNVQILFDITYHYSFYILHFHHLGGFLNPYFNVQINLRPQ